MAGFPDGVPSALQAADPVLTINAGPLQGRISQATGHVQLAGPDLSGAALANVVEVSPPAVFTADGPPLFGAVLSSTPVAGGLAVQQTVSGARIEAQLTFAHDGVLRYEVVGWGSPQPQETAIAGSSTAQEHRFGLGEKFDALDEAAHVVEILTSDDPGTKHDALTRYTAYTGRPPLPPWAFGPWISSDIWRSGGEVRYAVTTQLRDRGIPASAFVFDSPWAIAYNDFQWNMTQFGSAATIEGVHYPGFASPAEMMQFLRSNDPKVICWMTPFVNVSSNDEKVPGQNLGQSANYADGAAKGVFVRQAPGGAPLVVPWWKGRGSPVDYTSMTGRQWWPDQLRQLTAASSVVTGSGATEPVIGAFKTDDGESGNGPNTYIPVTAAGFIEVAIEHPGDTSTIEYQHA